MSFTAALKLKLGFLLLTLVPVLLGIVIWDNTDQLVSATRDVTATQELLRRLESFLSRIKDVEVAQREYVLTGDESYIREFQTARRDIEERLSKLSAVRSDEHWIQLLHTLVPQKFEEVEKTIEYRRSGDIDGASAMTLNKQSQPMEDIRRVVQGMALDETRLFEEHRDVRDHKLSVTAALSGVVLLINAVLIWTLFVYVQRESQRTAKQNEELEARVQQRTVELRRSNEELQHFAYAASHDLKEPMRVISSYATLLERRYSDQLNEDAQQWIEYIVDGVRRMNALITDLLEYSRAGSVADDEKSTIDVAEVLGRVLKNLEASIRETGARITFDTLPRVVFEPVRMEQLLQNLISNALKYRSDAAPDVHVSAKQLGAEVEFAIRDNGIGIPAEFQQDIFAIFKRLHGKEVEGTGIGLATCKRIVEEHGGRIWVESSQGGGSTFHFTVPVEEAAVDYHRDRARTYEQRPSGHRGTAASGN